MTLTKGTITFRERINLRKEPTLYSIALDVLEGQIEAHIDLEPASHLDGYVWHFVSLSESLSGYVVKEAVDSLYAPWFTFEASDEEVPINDDLETVDWMMYLKTLEPKDTSINVFEHMDTSSTIVTQIKLPQGVRLSENTLERSSSAWHRIQTSAGDMGFVQAADINVYGSWAEVNEKLHHVDFGAFTVTLTETERQLLVMEYTSKQELIQRILQALSVAESRQINSLHL